MRTRDGRELTLDGAGPLLGDFGSGYHLGSLALRAVTRSSWHPGFHTSLEAALFRALNVSSVWEILGLNDLTQDRSAIAALAPLVDAEANAGDPVALRIVQEAAAALADTVRGMVEILGLADESYALIGTGGVARGSRLYWDQLCGLVREFAPALRPVLCPLPPVAGVALASLLARAPDGAEEVRARLIQSMTTLVQQRSRR
jgi:N-acetylglucosamine kinase-like BadF-type ATPase